MITHYRVENNRYSRGEDRFTHAETLYKPGIMLSRRFNELPGRNKGPVNEVHELNTQLNELSRRDIEL